MSAHNFKFSDDIDSKTDDTIDQDENAIYKKSLGNTFIIGQSGSGKTVLMHELLLKSRNKK